MHQHSDEAEGPLADTHIANTGLDTKVCKQFTSSKLVKLCQNEFNKPHSMSPSLLELYRLLYAIVF